MREPQRRKLRFISFLWRTFSSFRAHLLTKAAAAAKKVRDEIKRVDDEDLTSSGPERRAPVLQRAKNQVRLLEIELTELQVDRLEILATRLDKAIMANALIDLAMSSLTAVLNTVSEVRETLVERRPR